MLRQRKSWIYYTYLTVVILLFLLMGGRLFYLQVVRGDYYRGLSSQNHIRVIIKPAPRGLISDRDGVLLADSRPSFIVTAVPSEFDTTKTPQLASLLGITEESLARILREASSVPHRPAVIRESMEVEEVSPVAECIYRMPGVLIDVAPLRRYHRPGDFSHMIGYVGLADEPGSYRGEVTGRTGIERSMNSTLQGEPGLHREVVDAMGRVVDEYRETDSEVPVPGENLTLTVDAELQRYAAEAVDKTGLAGAVVVVNYRTGEILCAASSPSYDPNLFARGITTAQWNALVENPAKPLFCRAWGASYPPASTFKIVTAYWLLSEGHIQRNTLPNPCYGSLTLGDTEFGCWTAHGRLDVVQALARSCDVFFYRTSQLSGIDELAEYARAFGLGGRLMDLLPDEVSGLVPDTDYLNAKYGPGGWGLGNLLNVSIGQGELLATPLQMAVMTGVIASRGDMPLPVLVMGESDRETVMPAEYTDPDAFDTVIEGMLQTVVSGRGTLHSAFEDCRWDFWGKTGTAECAGEDHAMVVGFVREPEPLAICVMLEHGEHGGTVAGPVARDILENHFASEVPN
ncbi:MAG: penicillin-binding protein 2 [Candidatus Aegiribacteria sp.]